MTRLVKDAPSWRRADLAQRGSPNSPRQHVLISHAPSMPLERRALRCLLKSIGDPPVAVALGDAVLASPLGSVVARVRIRDRLTLWKLALNPLYEFGEAYSSGRIEIDGDLITLLSVVLKSLNGRDAHRTLRGRIAQLLRTPRPNTLSISRDNIAHHYDIGNDFYRLWLDERMVYTCAYFPQPQVTLEDAQIAKLDLVCRKLRLRPGQTVVEAGCGWGSLALYMAQKYGVTVKAFNISPEQIAYAREQARQSGLDEQVEFVQDDWRNIQERCDVFVSVGMMEHVGPKNYRRLAHVIHRCLEPDGCGLIHTIGQNYPARMNSWLERRIFPGACPPTLRQMMDVFEPHDLSVLDVENLRLHYALTLRHWLDRFEKASDTVRQMFDERFVKMWRLYLCGTAAGFETGGLQLFQVVFARAANNQIPWTREDFCKPPLNRLVAPRSLSPALHDLIARDRVARGDQCNSHEVCRGCC